MVCAQALLDSGRGGYLESLTLCNCPKIRGWGLSYVFRNCCPNLQTLTLVDMDHLSPPDLRAVTLERGPVQALRAHRLASGLSSGLLTGLVAGISVLPKSLKTLVLQGPGAASLLRVAAEFCPQLEVLFLSNDWQTGPFSLAEVAREQLAELKTLGLIGQRAERFLSPAVESFLAGHPKVKTVSESGPFWGSALEWGLRKAGGGSKVLGGSPRSCAL
jgi:hypothetical protein